MAYGDTVGHFYISAETSYLSCIFNYQNDETKRGVGERRNGMLTCAIRKQRFGHHSICILGVIPPKGRSKQHGRFSTTPYSDGNSNDHLY